MKKYIFRVTGIDPDLWARAPAWDRFIVEALFALLFLVAGISGWAWAAFWGMFRPWWEALLVGAIAFVFMFLFDRLIGADWRMAGVLRRPDTRYGWEFWWRIGLRFLASTIFSLATSTGAQMAMSAEAIKMQIEETVRIDNQKITQTYDAAIAVMMRRSMGDAMDRVAAMQKEVDGLTPQVDKETLAVTNWTEQKRIAEANMQREATGKDGRPRGQGVRFRAAQEQEDEAEGRLATASRQLSILQPRLEQAQQGLLAATAGYDTAKAAIQDKIDGLLAERDGHLESVHQDALLSYMALQKVLEDPERGPAARWFGRIMMAVLITVEMSYIMIKTFFGQASIYTALLIQDAKRRMTEINDSFKTPGNDNKTDDAPVPIRFVSVVPPAATGTDDD